jgi:hypothetical protein
VRNAADDGVEHFGDGGVLEELGSAGAAAFDVDDQGEGLAAGVLFEVEFLRDAVVGEDEVAGVEGEDELAGLLLADQGGNEDQGGLAADGGWA